MKKVFALLMAAAMILSLAACGNKNPDSNPDSNDDSNDKKTTLILGTSADYAPFEFMYPDDKGELTYAGIDVSVAQYIADDMGLSLQVENIAFEYLSGQGRLRHGAGRHGGHPRPSGERRLFRPLL